MSRAAEEGELSCAAARFTHVVDDSYLSQQINDWIRDGEPMTYIAVTCGFMCSLPKSPHNFC